MKNYDTKPSKTETSEAERLTRFVTKAVAITVLLFFLMVVGCEMHSNTFDAERADKEAKMQSLLNQRDLEVEKTKRLRDEKIATLIGKGFNPIAVRCAFYLNTSRDETEACQRLGLTFPKTDIGLQK